MSFSKFFGMISKKAKKKMPKFVHTWSQIVWIFSIKDNSIDLKWKDHPLFKERYLGKDW